MKGHNYEMLYDEYMNELDNQNLYYSDSLEKSNKEDSTKKNKDAEDDMDVYTFSYEDDDFGNYRSVHPGNMEENGGGLQY